MFVYAVAVQGELGWSPLRSGLALTPMAAAFFVASLLTSRLLAPWGRSVLTAGLLVQSVGYAVLIVTVASRWPGQLRPTDLILGLLVAGFGRGLVMSPIFGLVSRRCRSTSPGWAAVSCPPSSRPPWLWERPR